MSPVAYCLKPFVNRRNAWLLLQKNAQLVHFSQGIIIDDLNYSSKTPTFGNKTSRGPRNSRHALDTNQNDPFAETHSPNFEEKSTPFGKKDENTVEKTFFRQKTSTEIFDTTGPSDQVRVKQSYDQVSCDIISEIKLTNSPARLDKLELFCKRMRPYLNSYQTKTVAFYIIGYAFRLLYSIQNERVKRKVQRDDGSEELVPVQFSEIAPRFYNAVDETLCFFTRSSDLNSVRIFFAVLLLRKNPENGAELVNLSPSLYNLVDDIMQGYSKEGFLDDRCHRIMQFLVNKPDYQPSSEFLYRMFLRFAKPKMPFIFKKFTDSPQTTSELGHQHGSLFEVYHYLCRLGFKNFDANVMNCVLSNLSILRLDICDIVFKRLVDSGNYNVSTFMEISKHYFATSLYHRIPEIYCLCESLSSMQSIVETSSAPTDDQQPDEDETSFEASIVSRAPNQAELMSSRTNQGLDIFGLFRNLPYTNYEYFSIFLLSRFVTFGTLTMAMEFYERISTKILNTINSVESEGLLFDQISKRSLEELKKIHATFISIMLKKIFLGQLNLEKAVFDKFISALFIKNGLCIYPSLNPFLFGVFAKLDPSRLMSFIEVLPQDSFDTNPHYFAILLKFASEIAQSNEQGELLDALLLFLDRKFHISANPKNVTEIPPIVELVRPVVPVLAQLLEYAAYKGHSSVFNIPYILDVCYVRLEKDFPPFKTLEFTHMVIQRQVSFYFRRTSYVMAMANCMQFNDWSTVALLLGYRRIASLKSALPLLTILSKRIQGYLLPPDSTSLYIRRIISGRHLDFCPKSELAKLDNNMPLRPSDELVHFKQDEVISELAPIEEEEILEHVTDQGNAPTLNIQEAISDLDMAKRRAQILSHIETLYYRKHDLEPIEVAIQEFARTHKGMTDSAITAISNTCKFQNIQTCGDFRVQVLGALPSDLKSQWNLSQEFSEVQTRKISREDFPEAFIKYLQVDIDLVDFFSMQWMPFKIKTIQS